jgi:uncharacterized protein
VSRENVELVRSAFDAWNRGEIEGFTENAAEDIEWVEVSGRPEGPPGGGVGRERLRRSLGTLFDAFESYRVDVERIHDLGDRVVAIVREVARGRASGLEIDSRWGYLITVEEGEMVRVEAYRDADLALEAAGLGESDGAA